MKLKWYGHSAFRLTDSRGINVIMDPYEPGCYDGGIGYDAIHEGAEIVTCSHSHPDHCYHQGISGNPLVITRPCAQVIRQIKIEGVGAWHDKSNGKERGPVVVFKVVMDDVRVCHLGDIAHLLPEKDLNYLKPIDVLMIPVGGHFTIDAEEAAEMVRLLQPKIIIPMHYKTPKCDFPIAPENAFTSKFPKVKHINTSEVDINRDNIPQEPEIWNLTYAG